MLRGAVTFFWSLFLADGVFSILDELLSLTTGSSPLSGVRAAFALSVLGMSVLMAAMIGVTSKVPKRVLVPLIVFAWWAGPAMGFPFGFWKLPYLAFGLAILQVLLALAVWWFSPSRDGKARTLPFALSPQPFSWKYLAVAGPVTAVLFILVAGSSVALGFSTQIELLTGGYVRLRPDGIYLIERQFQLGDREVRLAGMMHVARREFYSGVLPPPNPNQPSVVLVEGVTDRKRLLGGRTLDYGRLAKLLNVTSQSDSVFSNRIAAGVGKPQPGAARTGERPVATGGGIDFKHADVDIESFHPQTIAFILAVIGHFPERRSSRVVGPAFSILHRRSPTKRPGASPRGHTCLARNRRLASEIESSLKDYRNVIVPWGAMHLPEIESWLQTRQLRRERRDRAQSARFLVKRLNTQRLIA